MSLPWVCGEARAGRLGELGGCPCPQNPACLLGDLCQDKVLPHISSCSPIWAGLRSSIPENATSVQGEMLRGKFVRAVQCSWVPVIPLCPETSP